MDFWRTKKSYIGLCDLHGGEKSFVCWFSKHENITIFRPWYLQLCVVFQLIHLPEVNALYLHSNNISNIQEVDKLASLKHLTKLTLHGNPIENIKVLYIYVPSLRVSH
jgi:Leucine-rich repeat (LRR) protein